MQNPPPAQLTIEQALSQAHAHWIAGQADQAERLCQQVLALWPGQSDAMHLLGLMAHAYGNLDLAIDYLRRACQSPRTPAIYLSNLAEMSRQRGLLAEAETAARRAVALDSTLIGAWSNLGIILQEQGNLEESRACLERVASLQPASPEAHNNLGNTLKRLGRLAQARAHYEQAIGLAPAYAEAYSNLANVLDELGQPEQALAAARHAIELNPRLSDAYVNAAALELGRSRVDEALRWTGALLSYAPLHAGGLIVQAAALRQAERLEEALAAIQQAIAQQPDSGKAHNVHGEILHALGRPEQALAAYDKVAGAQGFPPEKALINRAVLLMELGDTQEAKAVFDHVTTRFPGSAAAWFNRADLHTFTPGDPSLAVMEALLNGPDATQSRVDRIVLHFALGKAWMDAGDAARAFSHLDQGNRLKREMLVHDSAATSRWIDDIIRGFPAGSFDKRAATQGSELAVFVVGMPRSGTTLIEQILASHPQTAGAGELTTLGTLVNSLGHYPDGHVQLESATLAALGQRYLELVRPLAGARSRIVDKMPSNFLYAGLIHQALPDARIIHVQRDAVDTCLSCYTKLFTHEQSFSYDQAELGRFYRDYERLMAHWRAVLAPDRFIEVRYEDVVDDLEGQARRLLAACGVEWDPACLDFHLTRRAVKTASVNQVRRPLFRSSVGRWRPYAAQLAPLLQALGVDPAEQEPASAARKRPATAKPRSRRKPAAG